MVGQSNRKLVFSPPKMTAKHNPAGQSIPTACKPILWKTRLCISKNISTQKDRKSGMMKFLGNLGLYFLFLPGNFTLNLMTLYPKITIQ